MIAIHRSAIALAFVEAAVVAAAAAPALAASEDPAGRKQESEQPMGGTWITTTVKAELATADGVKSMDISVKTVNGVVTLTGTQPDRMAIQKAVATAEKVKGVQRVDAIGLTVVGTSK